MSLDLRYIIIPGCIGQFYKLYCHDFSMKIVNTSNINEARKEIEGAFKDKKKIIVVAKDEEFNRKILENDKVDVIFGFENNGKQDRLKQRDSGLNQVLCKLAKENKISIGLDFKDIEKKDVLILERIIQNIRLCKKYNVQMVLINSSKDFRDLFFLLLTLGMTTKMAKFAVDNCFKISSD